MESEQRPEDKNHGCSALLGRLAFWKRRVCVGGMYQLKNDSPWPRKRLAPALVHEHVRGWVRYSFIGCGRNEQRLEDWIFLRVYESVTPNTELSGGRRPSVLLGDNRACTLPDCMMPGGDERLRAELSDAAEALGKIADMSIALRHGGPDPDDLNGLHDALDEAVDLAYVAHGHAQRLLYPE